MKKTALSLLAVAMAAFFLPSCGSDDEPSGGSSGKVTVQYQNASTVSYEVESATFSLFSQGVSGTEHFDYSEGATFLAYLDDEGSTVNWQFQTRDEIAKGAKLSVSGIYFGSYYYYTDEAAGSVKVKSVSDGKITLSFDNFQFDRKLDSGKEQGITINGTVEFLLDD